MKDSKKIEKKRERVKFSIWELYSRFNEPSGAGEKSFQLMILSLTLVSRLHDSLFSYTHQCESIKPDRRVKTAHSFMTIKSSTFLLLAFHADDIVMEVIVIQALRSYWAADLSCRPVKIAVCFMAFGSILLHCRG